MIESLPPVDVSLSDLPGSAPEKSPEQNVQRLHISPADLEVLRRLAPITAAVVSDSKPPESRSMRAAKKTVGAGRYVALITGTFVLASEAIRLWRPEYASAFGAVARFVLQLVSAQ